MMNRSLVCKKLSNWNSVWNGVWQSLLTTPAALGVGTPPKQKELPTVQPLGRLPSRPPPASPVAPRRRRVLGRRRV